MVMLISIGDCLMGIYLIVISAYHVDYGNKCCRLAYCWLSSVPCAVIGVLNTTATQLTLFAMMMLSVIRVSSLKKMIPTDGTTIKNSVKLLSSGIILLGAAVIIAVLPLVNIFGDFFVNGLF